MTSVPKLGSFVPIMGTNNMKKKNIGEALFPKIKREILTLFFLNPDKKFYTREIIRLINSNPGPVQRELKQLINSGIIFITSESSKKRYYQVNTNCSIYTELKGIVLKTFGVVDIIKEALAPIQKELQLAIIYGSVANNTDTGNSDIDELIISDISFKDIAIIFDPIQKTLQREINYSIYPTSILLGKKYLEHHFLSSVFNSEIITLYGSLK